MVAPRATAIQQCPVSLYPHPAALKPNWDVRIPFSKTAWPRPQTLGAQWKAQPDCYLRERWPVALCFCVLHTHTSTEKAGASSFPVCFIGEVWLRCLSSCSVLDSRVSGKESPSCVAGGNNAQKQNSDVLRGLGFNRKDSLVPLWWWVFWKRLQALSPNSFPAVEETSVSCAGGRGVYFAFLGNSKGMKSKPRKARDHPVNFSSAVQALLGALCSTAE